MLRAGILLNRVEIQEVAHVQDAFGDALQTWTTIARRWVSIEPSGGREPWQADQQRPDRSGTITMRPYPTLTSKHRFKFGTRILNIESVITVEENAEIMRVTYCEEV